MKQTKKTKGTEIKSKNKDLSEAIVLVLILTFINSIAQIFFKNGSAKLKSTSAISFLLSIIFNINVIIAISLYAISAVMLIYALKKGELSVVYPTLGTTYIWVALIAHYYFHENTSPLKIIGISIIIIGVAILGIGSQRSSKKLKIKT
ncbi:MAG: hypothetical protein GWP09_01925 [Nitrospiraceae bacterium]|nr:hypothetical protein [Nitrospiraceae bacterium]